VAELLHFNWNRKVAEEVCGGRTCEFALQNLNASAKDNNPVPGMSEMAILEKKNGEEQYEEWYRTGQEILLITIHEWQM
jgi:hypothetical protein